MARESIPSRSLGYKLGWTIALSIFFLVATCTFMLFEKKAEMLESRKSEVRHLVEAAYNVLVHFQQQEQLGQLSGEAARAQAVRRSLPRSPSQLVH